MPSIQDLEQFRASFRNVGGEAAARARDGRGYQELPLPEGGDLDAGIASLLEPGLAEPAPEAPKPEASEPEAPGNGDFDFSAFLDSIPDDFGKTEEPAAPEEPTPEEAEASEFPEEDFGLPSQLIDGLAEEIESLPQEESPAPAEAETGGNLPDFDFDLPEGFGPEEGLDLGGIEPPQAAAVGAEAVETEAEGGTEDIFGDAFPGGLEEAEGTPPPAEAEGGEAFDLFTEEAPPVSQKRGAKESRIEDFDLDQEPPPAEGGDEFSIPDFSFDETGGPGQEREEVAFEEPGSTQPPATGEQDFGSSDFGLPEEGGPDFGASDFGSSDFGASDFGAADFGSELPEEGATGPLDSFDTFSLDDTFSEADFGGAEKAEGKAEDFGVLEDFSLEGIDDVFKSSQPTAPQPARGKPAPQRGPRPPAGEVEEINLSEEDFSRLQDTLARYPLNLRIACEELIAEHAIPPDQMSALVKMLVRGSPARETASFAGRLIGKSIVIPKGFEKSSGAALEAERNTFTYAFFHNILPVLRIFAFAAVVTASMVYLGFEFVYKPLRAEYLYTQGEKNVLAGDYSRGNARFEEAGKVWRKKKWYYRYAEAFIDMRQYLLAEEKYDQLLRWYPRDKKGALDYANLETYVLFNYEKADSILRHQILDYNAGDVDALLAQGDNNLAWGDYDPSRYEQARVAYTRLLADHGQRDEYLERMLLYFIRTDKLSEVLPLQEHFLASKKAKISAPTLAELGGYLLDKKITVPKGVPDPNIAKIENIKKLLILGVDKDPGYPESSYQLTRYYEHYGQEAEERGSAEMALKGFDDYAKQPLRKALTRYAVRPNQALRWTKYRIDTYRRLAGLYVRQKAFPKAEATLGEGIDLFEEAVGKRVLPQQGEFGRLYADLGDLEYFVARDLGAAAENYRKAIGTGWDRPEVRYRLGYTEYAQEQWEAALVDFFKAAEDLPLNRRLLFALGNTLYRRGDLNAAQGYYSRLLEMLTTERGRFKALIPSERPEHADLADRLMRARNNLGVTLIGLAERNGDSRFRSRALALYAESAQAWDALTRDPKTMVRSDSKNLANLNTQGSLYPTSRFEPQIFTDIDVDVLEPSPWEELMDKN